jgi:hypothetical protein
LQRQTDGRAERQDDRQLRDAHLPRHALAHQAHEDEQQDEHAEQDDGRQQSTVGHLQRDADDGGHRHDHRQLEERQLRRHPLAEQPHGDQQQQVREAGAEHDFEQELPGRPAREDAVPIRQLNRFRLRLHATALYGFRALRKREHPFPFALAPTWSTPRTRSSSSAG